jgi:hypothetical protein
MLIDNLVSIVKSEFEESLIHNIAMGFAGTISNQVLLTDAATPEQHIIADAIAIGFNTLTIEASPSSTIQADDTDQVVITCAELSSFDVQREYNGIIEDESRISDGSIEFTAYSVGTYTFIIKEIDEWRTGIIEIEAIAP